MTEREGMKKEKKQSEVRREDGEEESKLSQTLVPQTHRQTHRQFNCH